MTPPPTATAQCRDTITTSLGGRHYTTRPFPAAHWSNSRPRLALIDRAVETHVANEHRILSALKAADLAALDHKLALLLAALESPEEQ